MLFATVATDEDRNEVQRLASRVDALSVSEQPLYLPAHEKLHRRIAEGARCPALSLAIEKTHALASTWFCIARQPSDPNPPRGHQSLVQVLIAGTPQEAAEAMRQHVKRGMENTMNRLKPYFRIRKAYGKTFFRSERRQKQQLSDPSALN